MQTLRRPAAVLPEVYYPESDGKPMAETDLHRDEMVELIHMLRYRYRDDPEIYVSGNMLVYYEEGNPLAGFAPDVFVVFGVHKHRRRIFKIWEEGRPPAVVFEVSSRKTRRVDLDKKLRLCERLGVGEYYLYDPESDYLKPPLQGHLLDAGVYRPVQPDAEGALLSPRLRLKLWLDDDGFLQLIDPETGLSLQRIEEIDSARHEAEMAQYDAVAAQQAAEAAQQTAEAAQQAAEAARRAAEARAAAAEAELARLRGELPGDEELRP
jgi:Uma2 family endonuclease